jgi:hypothetical protein
MENKGPIYSFFAVLLVPIYSFFALLQFKLQWMRFKARMRKYDQRVVAR